VTASPPLCRPPVRYGPFGGTSSGEAGSFPFPESSISLPLRTVTLSNEGLLVPHWLPGNTQALRPPPIQKTIYTPCSQTESFNVFLYGYSDSSFPPLHGSTPLILFIATCFPARRPLRQDRRWDRPSTASRQPFPFHKEAIANPLLRSQKGRDRFRRATQTRTPP